MVGPLPVLLTAYSLEDFLDKRLPNESAPLNIAPPLCALSMVGPLWLGVFPRSAITMCPSNGTSVYALHSGAPGSPAYTL